MRQGVGGREAPRVVASARCDDSVWPAPPRPPLPLLTRLLLQLPHRRSCSGLPGIHQPRWQLQRQGGRGREGGRGRRRGGWLGGRRPAVQEAPSQHTPQRQSPPCSLCQQALCPFQHACSPTPRLTTPVHARTPTGHPPPGSRLPPAGETASRRGSAAAGPCEGSGAAQGRGWAGRWCERQAAQARGHAQGTLSCQRRHRIRHLAVQWQHMRRSTRPAAVALLGDQRHRTFARMATPSTSPRRVVRSADSHSRCRPWGSSHCFWVKRMCSSRTVGGRLWQRRRQRRCRLAGAPAAVPGQQPSSQTFPSPRCASVAASGTRRGALALQKQPCCSFSGCCAP